jgi:predicted transcriptional regulator
VKATGRTRPALVYQAIRDLVDREQAFFAAVERGMTQAHAGLGMDLEDVNDELERIIADARKPH